MGKRLAGTCYFKVDGEQLELQGDLEFPFNSVTRETMASTTGVVGFKETVTVPYVAGTFIGMVYTLSEAFMVGDIPYKPIDGTVALRFEGTAGELA